MTLKTRMVSIGIDRAWIGVGVAYPSSASARSRGGARERSAKVMGMVTRRLRRLIRLRRFGLRWFGGRGFTGDAALRQRGE